ncbi:MAG: MBL fold metallo-hydrolase [Theionarchaea archaeon]|nr:MBL fold metallo-hydrolase [Theionarchaea archaeon]
MDTQHITEYIALIKGKNNGRFPFSHSILIEDDVTALIDTGCGIETLKSLKSADIIVNSHSHPDHTAGNWIFPECPLIVPEEDRDINSNVRKLSRRYAGEELAGVWRAFVSQFMDFKDAVPTKTFCDESVLDFGETKLLAVYTPGHTLGHYCFFERKEKILFSFDIDFTGFGPWYGHIESDIKSFKMSIERVRNLGPRIVVSSHRGIIKEGIEDEFDRFVEIFQKRDERLLNFLEKEKEFEEIVDEALIYRDFSFHPQLLKYWEGWMIQKHLRGLIDKGLVMETGKGFVNIG